MFSKRESSCQSVKWFGFFFLYIVIQDPHDEFAQQIGQLDLQMFVQIL